MDNQFLLFKQGEIILPFRRIIDTDTAYYDSCSYKPYRIKNMSLLDNCFSVDNLHESFMDIRKSIHFKYSVQNYRINELREISRFRTAYRNGTFTFSESRPFKLKERGHERLIHPIVFRDRVVIHAFCKYVLLPKLTPYLIYDNCASLKGKGIDKSLDRLRVHLQRYYFRNKTNHGYILKGDCRKFFDNLQHDIILNSMRGILDDEEIDFLRLILKENEIDVSYMTDAEYASCMNTVFSSIEYNAHDYPKAGDRIMRKSVGIGSEASQIIGLFYLHDIDNYIKIVRGFKYYGRYMDDFYIIHEDRQALIDILDELKRRYKAVGLEINNKKTQISRLEKPITFLKTIFILTDTGKIIKRKCADTFKRERIKLKKFAYKLDAGDMPYKAIDNKYRSWRGNVSRKGYKNYRQVSRMDKLYNELYIEPFIDGSYARC